MWKTLLIFFVVIVTCHSQNTSLHYHKRKPPYYYDHDPYYHHLLYGGGILYYMAFILIKIKFAFILGTILTIIIAAGKLFAIIKYTEYMNKPTKHHETEKIYIPSSSHAHDDHGPPTMNSYSSFPYPSPYSSGMTVDKLPPNAEIAGGGQYYDSPPPNAYGGMNYGHGRQISNSHSYYDLFISMFQKLNLTDVAFKTMKLNSIECRKKFVCKTDYNSKYSKIFSTTLNFMRDKYYDQYRTNATIESLADCDRLYQSCKVNI